MIPLNFHMIEDPQWHGNEEVFVYFGLTMIVRKEFLLKCFFNLIQLYFGLEWTP